MKKTGLVGGIVFAVIIVIVLGCLFALRTTVPAGYVAVQYSMNGGVKDEVFTQGWHIKSPIVTTTLYSIGLEQSYLTSDDRGDSPCDESFEASSSEGKAMKIDLTYTYQYEPENVVSVFKRFKGQSGKEVRDSFIKPNIISWTKEVLAKWKISDILGAKRADVNAALTDYLGGKFETYGITVKNVSLVNVEVDEDTRNAINAKIKAEQDAATQAINNQVAIDKAEAERTVKQTEADAEAYAIIAAAEAQAEANEKINASISADLINYLEIQNWNGVLPSTFVGNSDAIPVISTSTSSNYDHEDFDFDFESIG